MEQHSHLNMKKTAILLGGSGVTGSILLQKLIEDDRYEIIKSFSRSKINGVPKKVIQYVGNLLTLETFQSEFTGDEVFCCIGTTAKKTPNKAQYKAIDYGIPVAAAALAKANGIDTFSVISSVGANAKSFIFYNKIKGEMERDVREQNIQYTYILQPSIIDGQRAEHRFGEKLGLLVFKTIQPFFVGGLRPYKVTKATHIADTLIKVANTKPKETILKSSDIKSIATHT